MEQAYILAVHQVLVVLVDTLPSLSPMALAPGMPEKL